MPRGPPRIRPTHRRGVLSLPAQPLTLLRTGRSLGTHLCQGLAADRCLCIALPFFSHPSRARCPSSARLPAYSAMSCRAGAMPGVVMWCCRLRPSPPVVCTTTFFVSLYCALVLSNCFCSQYLFPVASGLGDATHGGWGSPTCGACRGLLGAPHNDACTSMWAARCTAITATARGHHRRV